MSALSRPLDQVLPARLTVSLIFARKRVTARARRAAASLLRGWRRIQPWLAGAAIVLAWSSACSWLDARDAEIAARAAHESAAELRNENGALHAQLKAAGLSGDRTVFYVLEGTSISQIAEKMERLSRSLAGDTYQAQTAAAEERKARK